MNMHIFPTPALLLLCILLAACGNKNDLLLSSQSPPEDAGRYLIKPKSEPAHDNSSAAEPEAKADDDR